MSCPATGKIQYETEEDAKKAIPRIVRKYGASGEPYYCMYCSHWHLGRRQERSRKKRRKRT
jgi:hypothetical protein